MQLAQILYISKLSILQKKRKLKRIIKYAAIIYNLYIHDIVKSLFTHQ